MKKILLLNHYSGVPLEIVKSALPVGFELLVPEKSAAECVEPLLPEADYILAGGRLPLTGDMLSKAPKLKMIQRTGVGLDSLDLDAIKARGIPLYVNRGINAQSVAEHALLLMLACLRQLTVADRNTRRGVWLKQEHGVKTRELHGKTVGIVGMGSAAKALVRLLKPFGVNILYYDPFRADEAFEKDAGISYSDLDALLSRSDIISLHCALTGDTANLINRESISRMKDGAIIVNTARGAIVNAEDLKQALESGKLAFAALDVHAREPVGADYCLSGLENVILTPHIAGVTADSFGEMMKSALNNIALYDRGKTDEIEVSRYL